MDVFIALLSLHFQLAVDIAFQKLSLLFHQPVEVVFQIFTNFYAMDVILDMLLLLCQLVVDVVS